jgi:hypothetical protein
MDTDIPQLGVAQPGQLTPRALHAPGPAQITKKVGHNVSLSTYGLAEWRRRQAGT